MSLFAINIIGTGIIVATVAVFLEWDQIFLILNAHLPAIFESKGSKTTLSVIRYCLLQ